MLYIKKKETAHAYFESFGGKIDRIWTYFYLQN